MSGNVLDLFQSTDNKLDRLEQQVSQLTESVDTLARQGVTEVAGDTGPAPGRLTERPARPLEMSRDVPANTQPENPETVNAEVPFAGEVLFVDLHWSDGSAGLAGVQFGRANGETFVPFNEDRGFLAANDYGNRYPLNATVGATDQLQARFINLDGSNSHLINVFPTIARAEE